MNTRYQLPFLFVLVVALVAASAAADEPDRPTITVTGSATTNVVPDQAVLTASVSTRNKSLDAGVEENDNKIKSVIEFLKQSGVDEKFIRTEVIRINPIYPSKNKPYFGKQLPQQSFQSAEDPFGGNAPNAPNLAPPVKKDDPFEQLKPIGYEVRRQLGITVMDLDSFEKIYRGLIKAGINDISGIEFKTSEMRKHKDEARLKAIVAAKEKAKALAGALGAKLAFVQTISEEQFNHRASFSNVIAFSDSSGSSMTTGMMEIKSTVRVVFLLKENATDE